MLQFFWLKPALLDRTSKTVARLQLHTQFMFWKATLMFFKLSLLSLWEIDIRLPFFTDLKNIINHFVETNIPIEVHTKFTHKLE